MKTIREAADSLLSKGEITQEDYSMLEDSGMMEKDASVFSGIASIGKSIGSGIAKGTRAFGKGFQSTGNALAANIGNPLKNILMPLGIAGAAGFVGKEAIIDPLVQKAKIKKSFEEMKMKVPQLNQYSDEELKDSFNVIKTFSPTSASNPLVAGHIVNKMLSFGGIDHKLVQDIANIESSVGRPSVLGATLEAGGKAIASAPDSHLLMAGAI